MLAKKAGGKRMANQEHLDILRQGGVEVWNEWRIDNPDVQPDLSNVDFSETNLDNVDFHEADLRGANLSKANLTNADLSGANLSRFVLNQDELNEYRNTFYN